VFGTDFWFVASALTFTFYWRSFLPFFRGLSGEELTVDGDDGADEDDEDD